MNELTGLYQNSKSPFLILAGATWETGTVLPESGRCKRNKKPTVERFNLTTMMPTREIRCKTVDGNPFPNPVDAAPLPPDTDHPGYSATASSGMEPRAVLG